MKKIIVISIVILFLLTGYSSTIAKPINDIEESKEKLINSPDTDVPPGTYTFKNMESIFTMGLVPQSKMKLSTQGIPLIKSFFMQLFSTGRIGGILLFLFPYIFDMSKETYTLTLDYSKSEQSADLPNTATIVYQNVTDEEPQLSIIDQRHIVTVEYEYSSDIYTGSVFVVGKESITTPTSAIYVGVNCTKATIEVL